MRPTAPFPASFLAPWEALLQAPGRERQQRDDVPPHVDLDALVTTSRPRALHTGTGHAVLARAVLPAVAAARHSVHLVTCYWAASPSRDALAAALLQLAARPPGPPLRVTIGFSSRGLLQKLLHTASPAGYTYPPARWPALGLPDEQALVRGGVELTVKSLFFTPVSVVHPKYVIVDGARAFVPSCNVSWERWFEGCIELEGDVVARLAAFHQRVWGHAVAAAPSEHAGLAPSAAPGPLRPAAETAGEEAAGASAEQSVELRFPAPVPTVFLPSSHHRNPRFRLFPLLSQADPPMTPLNAALLVLFAKARRQITIVTPNVTSWPALEALLAALARGVNVRIHTSRRMMLLEQLVTAGTTTWWCLRRLVGRYRRLCSAKGGPDDVEAQPVAPGRLEVLYFAPLAGGDEPTASHLKATLVDDEFLVLGSGNMDRASWWTSQEIGVLFHVPGFSGAPWDAILARRSQVYYRSG